MKSEKLFFEVRWILKKFPFVESLLNFILRYVITPHSRRILKFGKCSLCGMKTIFIFDSSQLRSSGNCLFCSASTRYKSIAEVAKKLIILKLISNEIGIDKLKHIMDKINLSNYSLKTIAKLTRDKNFLIYEPSSYGAIYYALRKNPKFLFSEYLPNPNLQSGDLYRGVLFEDLQSLSFESESFDLLITQDVLEHVKKPFKAFEEIHRVLKVNGVHIFTVPIGSNPKTFHYFSDTGNPILNRTVYHKDPLRPEGILVFTQFGRDLTEILDNYGFSSILINSNFNSKKGLFRSDLDVIISIKK